MPVWWKARLCILRMYRIDGTGRGRRPQPGWNHTGRGHFQNLHQNWPEKGEVQRKLAAKRCIADIAMKKRNVTSAICGGWRTKRKRSGQLNPCYHKSKFP